MAEFCKQCHIPMFGETTEYDFAGLTTKEDDEAGLAAIVLCEGCGPIQVSPDGSCISSDCIEKHGHEKE